MTPEREKYHELLAEAAKRLPAEAVVVDIGRTHAHDYREWFPRQTYLSIDRNPKAAPSLLLDVEQNVAECHQKTADLLLCNGVTESATNPFRLASGCFEIVKHGGAALFGIRLTGYPVSDKHDLTRFTVAGAVHVVSTAGFTIEATRVVDRGGVPSYAFLTCRRPPC